MLVECLDCNAFMEAEVLTSYDYYDEDVDITGRYSFLKCPRCGQPLLVLQTNDSAVWDSPKRIYPSLETGASLEVPSAIRSVYEEARSCFRAKAFTATAIMCRKALEAICEEHKIVARNLALALGEMRDKGIIESRLYEWADTLRITGNEAAHTAKATISAEDARDILEFTHALLEYVFTFRDRFERFKNRRANNNQAT